MAFALYSDLYWFPDGTIAANTEARVFPMSSNVLAPLFTDITGTVALPNPIFTDGSGVLTFWAQEGEYWVHIDSESFRISVGNPVQLDAWDGASVALSTGIMSNGHFSAAGTSISVQETVGYVVDYSTDSFRPTLARVHVPAQVVPLSGAALARTLTWILISSTGTFVELSGPPTDLQRRTHIVLGFVIVIGGVAVFTKPVPVILPQPANQLADLMDALGTFIISGNLFTPNGVNLMLNTSGGVLFSRSFGYELTPQTPHVAPTAAQAPAQFRRATSTTTVFPLPVTTVDPANYDVGGVITPVPGGANTSTLQRIFVFAQANAPDQILIQYGQATYASLSAAVAAVGNGGFITNPAIGSTGALAAYLAVIKSATDLSSPTQAVIIPASKFDRP